MAKANENREDKQAVLTAVQKRKVVKAMCLAHYDKFGQKEPRVKQDLHSNDVKALMYLRDDTKKVFKEALFNDEIDYKDSLSKYRNDVLAKFAPFFKSVSSEEDIEDLQLELTSIYEDWYSKNHPKSKKRISPSTIKVSNLLTFLAISEKSKALPNLAQHGVNDFTTWRVKDMKLEALKACREFISNDNPKSA